MILPSVKKIDDGVPSASRRDQAISRRQNDVVWQGPADERAIERYSFNIDLGLTLIVKDDEDADQNKNKYQKSARSHRLIRFTYQPARSWKFSGEHGHEVIHVRRIIIAEPVVLKCHRLQSVAFQKTKKHRLKSVLLYNAHRLAITS